MGDSIETILKLLKDWEYKTLEELRCEAEGESTGIAFDTIRVAGGYRFFIVLCVTDLDQIARLEKVLDLIDDGITEDWNNLTLAKVSIRTLRGGSITFESLRDEYGRRTALVLVAADPQSIGFLETTFSLPK